MGAGVQVGLTQPSKPPLDLPPYRHLAVSLLAISLSRYRTKVEGIVGCAASWLLGGHLGTHDTLGSHELDSECACLCVVCGVWVDRYDDQKGGSDVRGRGRDLMDLAAQGPAEWVSHTPPLRPRSSSLTPHPSLA